MRCATASHDCRPARCAQGRGCSRVLIVPAYPQYSGTTTASVFDAVYDWASPGAPDPELRFVNRYHDQAGYIEALKSRVQQHWLAHGRPDKLLLRLPRRAAAHARDGRPLPLRVPQDRAPAGRGARIEEGRLRRDLPVALRQGQVARTLHRADAQGTGRQGAKRVDVICPGFTSDCLETLEEIAQEGREAFLHAGGQEFHYIACLNDSTPWIRALAELCEQHLAGWPTREPHDAAQAEASRLRAVGMGAKA